MGKRARRPRKSPRSLAQAQGPHHVPDHARHYAGQLRANGADEAHLEAGRALVAAQNDDAIMALYERLKGHPLVRWKDSIRTVVGLAEESEG